MAILEIGPADHIARVRFGSQGFRHDKSLRNLKDALALHFAHYNFVRIHGSLRVTPAMAAGVTNRVWNLTELLAA